MLNLFAARKCAAAGVLCLLATWQAPAIAEEELHFTTITLGATTRAKENARLGTGTEDGRQILGQFEHFGITGWGTFYLDLETTHGHGVGSIKAIGDNGNAAQSFIAAIPRVSFTKVTGRSFTFGPINDVSLIARYLQSSYYHYQAIGVGLTFNLQVPGFFWFDTGLMTHDSWWDLSPTFDRNTGRRQVLDRHKWAWRTYAVSKPLDWEGQRFHLDLQAYVNSSGSGGEHKFGTEVLLIPDFMWSINGNSDHQLGLRLIYSKHKNDLANGFGPNNYSHTTPMLVFKYSL